MLASVHSIPRSCCARVAAASRPRAAPRCALGGDAFCVVGSDESSPRLTRRTSLAAALAAAAVVAAASPAAPPAFAADESLICDDACASSLDAKELVTLPSGLSYRDVVVGRGPTPEVGQQVVVDYVAMTKDMRVFENTKLVTLRVVTGDKESPAGIPGLNEGLKTMQPGGVRRLYIPGALGFPKGLASGPGRPRVPPLSDVVFDVKLLLIPGVDYE